MENIVRKGEIASSYKPYTLLQHHTELLNSLTKDKILDNFKLEACGDDKVNVTRKLKFALKRIENIVENGENAGWQHFLLFPLFFQKTSYTGSLKVWIV